MESSWAAHSTLQAYCRISYQYTANVLGDSPLCNRSVPEVRGPIPHGEDVLVPCSSLFLDCGLQQAELTDWPGQLSALGPQPDNAHSAVVSWFYLLHSAEFPLVAWKGVVHYHNHVPYSYISPGLLPLGPCA